MNVLRFRTVIRINLQLCIIEVLSHRTRSIITSFGIFLGISSVLINIAFLRGIDDDIRQSMEQSGGLKTLKAHSIQPVNTKEALLFQKSPGLSIDEAVEIARQIPDISAVLLYNSIGWRRCKSKENENYGKIIAVTSTYCKEFNYTASSGRMLDDTDLNGKKMICVIGSMLGEDLFGKKVNPVGKVLTIEQFQFEIVGVIYTSSPMMNGRSYECLIPYTVYEKRFGEKKTNIAEITFICNDVKTVLRVKNSLQLLYEQYHRGVNDVEIEANVEKLKQMQTTAVGIKVLLWCIAFISLGVGGISIMNIMFATIGNRIREIGIRKAIGAQPFDIFIQFLIESVGLCCVGGFPGLAIGSLITMVPPGVFPYLPRLELIDYCIGFGFILISGFIAGFFPSLKASSLKPAEALRF